jgi:Right handed beta helix region
MSAGQPNYPDGGEMRSTFRTMLTALLTASMLSGCVSDLMAPSTPDDVSASVVMSLRPRHRALTLSLSDSTLSIGDTIRVVTIARNTRTNRDVTREVRLHYSSSDTSVAVIDRRGLVTARSKGLTTVSVRSILGSATLELGVEVTPSGATDTTTVSSLPGTIDTQPTPAVLPSLPVDLSVAPPFAKPTLPADTVDVSVPHVTGRTLRVAANDPSALQSLLNTASGGDEVVLPNGSEYVGNFTLPKHSGSGVVTVRSETVSTSPGSRLLPGGANGLARIITPNVAPAIATAPSASGWRLIGLSISLRAGAVDNYGIVTLGSGTETALNLFVSNIVLDRVMISGGETGNTSRCVGFNGNALAVVNSWLIECHAKGRDAQGIGGWTGQGPFRIENNHIEGSGQNVMFGGADPAIANVSPSDITIRHNHFFKPMSWGNGRWTVKAAFELKNARRVLFEGNVIENHWADAQVGFAILFQAANQDLGAPWSTIQDVTVQNNIIKNSTGGFNLLSRVTAGGRVVNEPTKRVLVRNNLFVDVGRDPVSGTAGRYLQLMSDHEDVTIMQNTFVGRGANNAVMFDGEPNKRLMLFNNVFGTNEYGILGSGYGEGTASLTQFAPRAIVEGNAIAGKLERQYPAGNLFPAAVETAAFVNAAGGDYTLRATVSYSSNGGTIVGVNGAAILAAVRGAVSP